MAQSRHERIESKREKRMDKREQKEKDLRRKSDEILRQYLQIKDTDADAAKKRQKLSDKYFNIAPFKHGDFESDLEEYKNRMNSMSDTSEESVGMDANIEADTDETPEFDMADLLAERAKLKDEVDANLKNTVNLSRVAQEFYDAHLVPDDLTGGENQREAVKVAFSGNPELQKKMLVLVSMSKEDQETYAGLVEDTKSFLRGTRDKIASIYDRYREMRKTTENLSSDVTGKYLKGKIENVVSNFKEKPLASIAGLAGIAVFVYWISKGEGTKGFRDMLWKGIKFGAVAGGGLWGLNELTSMFRDDGRSLLDMALSNPDTYSYDSTMLSFKDELEKMTANNRYAFQAMMHIANVDSESVLALFDEAERSATGAKTINISALQSLSGLSQTQAGKVNGEGLYIGLEALMLKINKLYGKNKSSNKDSQLAEGKRIYREKFSGKNMTLASVIFTVERDSIKGDKKGRKGRHGGIEAGGAGAAGGMAAGIEAGESTGDPLLDKLYAQEGDVEKLKGSVSATIDEEFARLDKYNDTYWKAFKSAFNMGDKFSSFIQIRKKAYLDQMRTLTKDKKNADAESLIGDLRAMLAKLTSEIDSYMDTLDTRGTGSDVVLADMEREMVSNMCEDEIWKSGAVKVFNTLHRYEFEGKTYVLNDPEIVVDFVNVYLKKTNFVRAGADTISEADAAAYTRYFLDQIDHTLPNDANLSAGNWDGNIKQVSVDEWLASQNILEDIPDFKTWATTEGKPYAPELKENDRTRAVREQRIEEGGEFNDEKQKELVAIFERTDDLEWSALPSEFDAFVHYREEMYGKEIDAAIVAKTNPTEARADVDAVLDRARKEVLQYRHFELRQGSSSDVVLDLAEKQMIENIIDHAEWESDSKKVLNYAKAFNEFEGSTYVFDQPEMKVQFMDIYFRKIDFGKNHPEFVEDPANYTRYFIDQARRLLASDKNIDLGSDKFQISPNEWSKQLQVLEGIKTYSEWKAKREFAPEFGGFDAEDILRIRNRQEREVLLSQAQKDIVAAFAKTDGLEWSLGADKFDAFVGRRRQHYMDAIVDGIAGKDLEISKQIIDKLVDQAIAEAEVYLPYAVREGHNSPIALLEVEERMVEHMLDKTQWHESAKKVLNFTEGRYEFEDWSYTLDDPEIFVEFMDLFFKKINYGVGGHNVEDTLDQAEDYTRYFLKMTSDTLPKDPNISITNLDGYVRQISRPEWQRAKNKLDRIKTYSEYLANPEPQPELKENDLRRGVFDRQQEEGSEIMKYKQDRIDQVMASFEKVQDLDGSWLPSNFKAFVGMRAQWYVGAMNRGIINQPEAVARTLLDGYALKAQQEAQAYQQFEARKDSGSPVVLMEAEKIMLDAMISSKDWKKSSQKVLQYANGAFEFENQSYLINDPEMFNDFMSMYIENIDGGNAKVSGSQAEDYTGYFLFSMRKLLPNDKNWTVGSRRLQISNEEWESKRVPMSGIMTFAEWIAAGSPKKPELHENDVDGLTKERIEQEKAQSVKDFMDWYDKEMDPSQWFRMDGDWPEEFRKEVDNRVYIISNNPSFKNQSNEEFQATLQQYARYVKVEKRVFEGLIAGKVETSKLNDFVQRTITKQFNLNFIAGNTPQQYNDALTSDLNKMVAITKIIDSLTISVGPLNIPIPDPIQFTP